VKVPAAIGTLKPVILVPLGMLTKLSADQVEAILLHELAHIRRNDYFVNLLQSFAETLFFFNPAVLWLSSLIRAERENCCDDMVVAGPSSRKVYISALVAFQQHYINDNSIGMAMAFPGKQHTLLDRVRRIVSNENRHLNLAEKLMLLGSIMAICLLPLLFTSSSNAQRLADNTTHQTQNSAAMDSITPATDKSKHAPAKEASTARPYRLTTLQPNLLNFLFKPQPVPVLKEGDGC
ncbi:M56 family metallopeptidase, partial [Chitinophaga sp.]|uniref:M56 family metallopeptidase n=1 Tax=Chitinophaga sp. TaxID=1869181 RepID=UPI002F95B39C